MKFLYKQFQGKKKQIVEVELDRTTRVKFLTAPDFKAYRDHRTHKYYGGTFDRSPVRFVLPFDAVWTVVVEKGSFREPLDVQASCKLLPPDREVLSTVAIDAPPHLREPQGDDRREAQTAYAGEGSPEDEGTN
ncbi:MAG: DUF1883 domain-containing protein [Flavobacteriales bacterium]|nr:DUF1883 domain-containing protein [Flavobacteriales bacterium]MCB9166304.1 DUF1883 domain-containing protein [Flavobacteriales bacterium]